MPRARMIFFVALAALTLFACGRRRGREHTTFGARQVRELQQRAAHELGCTERGLTVTPLSDRVMQVHGCGQLRDYAYGTGRAAGWYPMQPVYVRAASEMACPVEQLSVQAPTAGIRNAVGCGRTARYDLVCGSLECGWTMTAHGGAWAGGGSVQPSLGGGAPGSVVSGADEAMAGVPEASASAELAPSAEPAPITTPAAGEPVVAPSAAAVITTSGDEVVIPAPPAPGSPEELLRAVLDAQRPQIHRCAGPGVIPVRASWSADGIVTIALDPPLAGTAVEGCLRIVVGAQRVPTISAGEIVHHVR